MENTKNNYNPLSKKAFIFSVIGALVGLISWIFLILVVIGFVMGIKALKQIKISHERGKGLATAAVVIGSIYIILLAVSATLLYTPLFR